MKKIRTYLPTQKPISVWRKNNSARKHCKVLPTHVALLQTLTGFCKCTTVIKKTYQCLPGRKSSQAKPDSVWSRTPPIKHFKVSPFHESSKENAYWFLLTNTANTKKLCCKRLQVFVYAAMFRNYI